MRVVLTIITIVVLAVTGTALALGWEVRSPAGAIR